MDILKKTFVTCGIAAVVVGTSAAAGLFGGTPANLVGEWRYTSIIGTTHWDASSGQYLGHGGGNSETYVFAKDGTFKDYIYMERSPSAGWTTKIYTTMEGRVEWEGDTYKLIPTKGHYKVQDNRVARQNYERPMTAEDIQRMTKSYRYSMSSENGKPVFNVYFGESKIAYKRAN